MVVKRHLPASLIFFTFIILASLICSSFSAILSFTAYTMSSTLNSATVNAWSPANLIDLGGKIIVYNYVKRDYRAMGLDVYTFRKDDFALLFSRVGYVVYDYGSDSNYLRLEKASAKKNPIVHTDNDTILFPFVRATGGTGGTPTFYVVRYVVSSNTFSTSSSSVGGTLDFQSLYPCCCDYAYYNEIYHIFPNFLAITPKILCTTPSGTISIKILTVTGTVINGHVFAVQNPDDNKQVIIMIVSDTDIIYALVDLSANTYTYLCSQPFQGRLTQNHFLQKIDAGIMYNSTLNRYCVYFTVVGSRVESGYRKIQILRSHLYFNNTISAANFLSMNERYWNTPITAYGGGQTTSVWVWGYPSQDKSAVNIFHPTVYNGSKAVYWFELGVGNIWDTDITSFTFLHGGIRNDYYFNYEQPYNVIYRDNDSAFAVERTTDKQVKIWYGFAPIVRTYSLTLNYAPTETGDILKTGYSYRFYGEVKRNNANFDGLLAVYIDGLQFKTFNTKSGSYEFYYTMTTAGFHNFTLILYDEGVVVKTLQKTYQYYTYTPSEEEKVQYAQLTAVENLINTIPIFLIVFIPTFLLFLLFRSLSALVVGFTLGMIMGLVSGLIPSYALYLYVLALILAIVFMRRGGE